MKLLTVALKRDSNKLHFKEISVQIQVYDSYSYKLAWSDSSSVLTRNLSIEWGGGYTKVLIFNYYYKSSTCS